MSKIEVISASVKATPFGTIVSARVTGATTIPIATHLVVTANPVGVVTGSPFSFTVNAVDGTGAVATGYTGIVVITHPAGAGSLGGTTSMAMVAGVATFNTLTLSAAGTGNTLHAASGSLTGVDSAPFSVVGLPSSISGLQLWLDAQTGVLNPSSGAAANGDAVATWTNRAAGGATCTQTTGANRPVRQTVSGKPVIRFAGGAVSMNIASLSGVDLGAFTTFVVAQTSNSTQVGMLLQWGTNTSQGVFAQGGYYSNLMAGVNGDTPAKISATAPQIMTNGYDATAHQIIAGRDATLLFKTQDENGTAYATTGAVSVMTLGTNGTYGFIGDVQAVLVYSRTLTLAEIQTVQAYLAAVYGVTLLPVTREYISVGDSISGGATANAAGYMGRVLGDTTATGILAYNLSLFGQTTTTIKSDFISRGIALIGTSGLQTTLIMQGGSNDMAQLTGQAATVVSNKQSLATTAKTNGVTKVVYINTLPRNASFAGGQTSGGFDTDRLSERSSAIAQASPAWDVIADVANDATIGPAAAAADTTYYTGGVHPVDAGHIIIAGILEAALVSIGLPTVTPMLSVSPTTLNFTNNGSAQTVTITNTTNASQVCTIAVSYSTGWSAGVNLSTASVTVAANSTATFTISTSQGTLAAATYTATVTVTGPGGVLFTQNTVAVTEIVTVGAYTDTFNRADCSGTISNGPGGAVYTNYGTAGETSGITSNQAVTTALGYGNEWTGTPGLADGTLDIDVINGFGVNTRVVVRGTDKDNFIAVVYQSGAYQIRKRVSGSESVIAGVVATATTSGVVHCQIVTSGSTISATVDGVSLGPITETFNQTAIGIGFGGNTTWDNFSDAP